MKLCRCIVLSAMAAIAPSYLKAHSIESPEDVVAYLRAQQYIDCANDNTKEKPDEDFRDYANAPARVKEFYQEQHTRQTYAFACDQIAQTNRIMNEAGTASETRLHELEAQGKIKRMSLWSALEELDNLIDQSDPDLDLPNSIHALQTAESIRAHLEAEAKRTNTRVDNADWMILVGLLHDIGKVDALLRQVPQWAVVGDTFPVGCAFSEKNVLAHSFAQNPDAQNPLYNTELGVYAPNAGLNALIMSWGHNEYGYQVLKNQGTLPAAALSIIRFHSFYPLHREKAYMHLIRQEEDSEKIEWIKTFNRYDLYSKSPNTPDKAKLAPYYKALINKYFPPQPGEEAKQLIWPVLDPVK